MQASSLNFSRVFFLGAYFAQSGAGMEGQDAAAMESGGEDIMQQMMGEFGKMGEKEVKCSTNQRCRRMLAKPIGGVEGCCSTNQRKRVSSRTLSGVEGWHGFKSCHVPAQ